MSQLMQLKQQLAALSNDAKNTAQGLAGFKTKFSQAVHQVHATVGGSAQSVDQQLIQSLQMAEKEVDRAIQALQSASNSANNYANSL